MSIRLEHINYVYSPGTAYEKQALKDISLEIRQGEFVGIIGHTGSGKSTLIQHFNGLIKAGSGALYFDGKNIYDEGYNMKELRNQVGLVFQYPEHQLLRWMFSAMYALAPRTRGWRKRSVRSAQKKPWSWLAFRKNTTISRPLSSLGDRSGGRP